MEKNYGNYCVFWYPTIFHGDLVLRETDVKTLDISDSSDGGIKHHISIELDKNSNLIVSSYPGSATEKQAEVTLNYIDHTKSGFYLYGFDIQENSPESIFIEKAIPYSVYHLSKTFYHDHELKEGGGDAILPTLIKKEKIAIRGRNNDCLKHYLEVYERKFKAYAEDISDQNSYIKKIHKNRREYFNLNTKKREKLISLCENAIIEYVYCKAILGSKHNRSCHPNIFQVLDNLTEDIVVDVSKTLPDDDDLLYKRALNIRNSIRYITFIKETNWIALANFNLSVTHIATLSTHNITEDMKKEVDNLQEIAKKNDKLGKISLVIAIISLVIALICGGINLWDRLERQKSTTSLGIVEKNS